MPEIPHLCPGHGAAVQAVKTRQSCPRSLSINPLGGHRGIPKPAERYNLSTAYSWSAQGDQPDGDAQNASKGGHTVVPTASFSNWGLGHPPIHIALNPFGSFCRWWAHWRTDLCLPFTLSPVRSYGPIPATKHSPTHASKCLLAMIGHVLVSLLLFSID